MTLEELTRDQLEELRVNTLHELFYSMGMGTPAYSDIALASDYVTDSFLSAYYEDTLFCDDDFTCTAAW